MTQNSVWNGNSAPWKKSKPNDSKTKWTSAEDSIANHPRLAGLIGILPQKTTRKSTPKGESIKRKIHCITEITAQSRNKIRKIQTDVLN